MGLAAIDEGQPAICKNKPMILGITAVGAIIPAATDGGGSFTGRARRVI